MENVARHEQGLIAYATKLLLDVPGLRIIGTAAEKAGVISFVLQRQAQRGRGHGPEPGRHRRSLGTPLRATDPAPLRPRKHRAPVVCALQHQRGHRRAGRGAPPDSERRQSGLTARLPNPAERFGNRLPGNIQSGIVQGVSVRNDPVSAQQHFMLQRARDDGRRL